MADRWEMVPEDEDFPECLRSINGSTVKRVYGMGDRATLQGEHLSVIGARRATPYGMAAAEMAGRIAAECGICVVSGGAMGCDHSASRAALDAGGTTIIVSGCGADIDYPRSSSDVFREARAGRGAVISLESWGSTPRRYAFPKRNVVIAAMSPCLFVTEAGQRSGTMSTADAAMDLGRTVYAVPGSIFSPNSQGTNALIRDGAQVVTSEVDLEARISLDYGRLRSASGAPMPFSGKILSALVGGPLRPDDLSNALGESVFTVIKSLSDYEMRGILQKLPDGSYAITQEAYRLRDQMGVPSSASQTGGSFG